ncbi:hypothetical protein RUM44_010215 [Polyplax serrata]|uniref:Uncharacterized protein n=1 Tax=Polyplax serrata TaxID=468196 RepID=A0ABR1AUX7_POLSC
MPVQTLDLWELSVGSPERVDLGAVGSENLVQKEENGKFLQPQTWRLFMTEVHETVQKNDLSKILVNCS